jgi:hypothetical protein
MNAICERVIGATQRARTDALRRNSDRQRIDDPSHCLCRGTVCAAARPKLGCKAKRRSACSRMR